MSTLVVTDNVVDLFAARFVTRRCDSAGAPTDAAWSFTFDDQIVNEFCADPPGINKVLLSYYLDLRLGKVSHGDSRNRPVQTTRLEVNCTPCVGKMELNGLPDQNLRHLLSRVRVEAG
jgi:hypothetical protein